MVVLAFGFSILTVICLLLPHPALFVAMGGAILGSTMGWIGYKNREICPKRRLIGAGAAAIGTCMLLLTGLKYGVTLVALSRIERFLAASL